MSNDWRTHASNPNDEAALAARARQMSAVRRGLVDSRLSWLEEICRDRRVLDVGCVDHDTSRVHDPRWLHARLVAVASECVGLDYEAEGVERLQALGYDVVHGDINDGVASVQGRTPFDVVVAGEVIEHLPSPQTLLEFAHEALGPGGLLALTTPNPYAPWRVRCGQSGSIWENVDHVQYLFPAGMAELANRTGFTLLEARTTDASWSRTFPNSFKAGLVATARRLTQGRSRTPNGRLGLPTRFEYLTPVDVALMRYRRSSAAMGETSLYLLARDS
jgi:SAM-dependent methyltransferase